MHAENPVTSRIPAIIRPLDDPNLRPKALAALAVGALMLAVIAAAHATVSRWSNDYGTTLVLLAVVVYIGFAALLLTWGGRTLIRRNAD